MSGHFIIQESGGGKYFFTLEDKHSAVLLKSKQYATWRTCKDMLLSVRLNAKMPSKYIQVNAPDNSFYFMVKAVNGSAFITCKRYGTIDERDQAMELTICIAPFAGEIDHTVMGIRAKARFYRY
jgi:uncharacterized protein